MHLLGFIDSPWLLVHQTLLSILHPPDQGRVFTLFCVPHVVVVCTQLRDQDDGGYMVPKFSPERRLADYVNYDHVHAALA
jgi:hypothetical protein